MMGDLDDLDDIADEVDIRTNRGGELRGQKRGRVVRQPHAIRGSLKTALARSKGRTKKVTLPSLYPNRS
jgi:hypothetical protein